MADRGSASITIEAPAAAVMAVIADFESYPQWARQIKQVAVLGRDEHGRPDQVRMTIDAGILRDEYVLAYRWVDDREVSWHLLSARVQKEQDGSYQLQETAPGRTEVRYELSVELGIPMLGALKRKAEKAIMDTALRELKKRVETAIR